MSETLIFILVFFLFYIAPCYFVYKLAKKKNREATGWVIISIILIHPFISLLILYFLREIPKAKVRKKKNK